MVTPHGIHVDDDGNVWVTDFVANAEGTKGHQVHKFSPDGELLMSLGTAGQPGSGPDHFNPAQRRGHRAGRQHLRRGRPQRPGPDHPPGDRGGTRGGRRQPHREVRPRRHVHHGVGGGSAPCTASSGRPTGIEIDDEGRVLVADRGNHRIEIFSTRKVTTSTRSTRTGAPAASSSPPTRCCNSIDSESSMLSHPNWVGGVRISPLHEDRVVGFIPPFEADTRPYQGAAGRGRRGGRGRQRVRGRGAELAALRGRRVHESTRSIDSTKRSPGLVGRGLNTSTSSSTSPASSQDVR